MPIVFVKEVSFSKQTHIINKITIQTCLHISKNDVRLHCIGHFADCIYVLLTYMCRYPHFQIVCK